MACKAQAIHGRTKVKVKIASLVFRHRPGNFEPFSCSIMRGVIMRNQTAMNQDMQRCIEACVECHQTCLQTAMNHCLETGGKHVEPDHFRLMLNGAEICQTSANFMMSSSRLHQRVCGVCAEVCDACAKSCEQVGDMDECVQACRRCAESCRRMAKA
jgi:hypothetical protein